ncbi:helicase-like transcription factor CHR28 isoform X1 [Canna indica]|uniref:Helicase-like transcription factor CHR28 isoform X1 n=1 Tax=Canna indica TaxID=4628 RepID=A0AAQ3KTP4_9LILI|nr:helicase-like transcription factor CHR28 isoform X1 [Canna indica]
MADAPPSSEDLFSADGSLFLDDNLAISFEDFNAILEEPLPPPSSESQSQVTSEGLNQAKPAGNQVYPNNASSHHAELPAFNKFNGTAGSQWSTLNHMGVSDCRKEENLRISLGPEESYNCHLFTMNDDKCHTSEHADSKSTVTCPSNWFTLSNQEHNDSSTKNLIGSSGDNLLDTNFHDQQLQYVASFNFDNAEEPHLVNSCYAEFGNDLYLDSGEKDGMPSFLDCKVEHDSQCNFGNYGNIPSDDISSACLADSSHTMMTEMSGLTNADRYDDRPTAGRNYLLDEKNLCGYSSMNPDSVFLNSNSESKLNATTNIIYNSCGSGFFSYRESPVDDSINGSSKTLHDQFPYLILPHHEERTDQRKEEKVDQMHQFRSSSRSNEVGFGTGLESAGSLFHDFQMAETFEPRLGNYAEENHLDDISLKSESSIDSSPLPSSRNSTSDDAHMFAIDESEESFRASQTNLQNKLQKASLKNEREDYVQVNRYQKHNSLKHSNNDVLKRNCNVSYISVDDDADLCILNDFSNFANPRLPLANMNNHTVIEQYGFTETYQPRYGGMRLKADDERLTFRLALQDLSQPKSEASPPDGALKVPLLRHQRIALHWMVQKETASLHCCGGILADDQGLGKTISTIALIVTERSPSPKQSPSEGHQDRLEAFNLDDDDNDDNNVSEINVAKKLRSCSPTVASESKRTENSLMTVKSRPAAGTLVVCPTSVLRQWAEELKTKVASRANLSFLVYHGSNRTKDPDELAKYDVVLTTYAIVSMEVPKQPLGGKDDEEKGKSDGHMGHITDKKRKSSASSLKKGRKDDNKTENALLESAARPLARVGWFRVILDEAQSIKNHRTQVARACWGLRAKRRWCLSGTPIQNAVDDLYSYFRFLRYDPYAVYKSFCSMIKIPISRNPTNGYKKLQAVLKTIMLRRTKGTKIDGKPIITLPPKTVTLKKVDFSEEERTFYTRLEAESREQFKVYANEGTVKQNYVNILLMLLRLRQACDHRFLVNGYGSDSGGSSSVEMVKKLPKEKQKDLLSCLEACLAICTICNDPPEDAVVTICGHVFCNQCISEHLNGDDNICPSADCKVRLSVASVFSRSTLISSISDIPGDICHSNGCGSEMVDASKISQNSYSSKIKAAIQILQSMPRSQCSVPEKNCHSVDLNEESDSSLQSGVNAISQGCSVDTNDGKKSDLDYQPSEKAIVFSQWTRMLDLLEVPLKDSCIQYRRLDGTMSVAARDKAIKDFNNIPEVKVMIMSLKAASLGLNLVVACHVLLLDLWWNPTTEDQAIDRAHRIGQSRPVTVSRLTVKDTVEDRILALQEKKREMVASAFGEDESGSRQTRLTVEDLKYLFMVP